MGFRVRAEASSSAAPRSVITKAEKPAMTDPIEIVDFATLDDFWEAMSPIGARFGQRDARFIFRGQQDSKWELIPRVFRASEIAKYKRGIMSLFEDHPGQFFFEWSFLEEF